MGFVNNILYKKRPLPEGVESDEFTTKDLEFGCLFYEISDEGRLLRDNEDGTYTDMKFNGQLYVSSGYSDYYMDFDSSGLLVEVRDVPDYANYCSDLSTPFETQPRKA